ncbi:MAG TPA: hypothetical protein VHS78_18560 [Candidatus Elarobacter sp.]|jgi:hypothetical protein|nr:hypothetical protein [Candidatus Elarobacter sp.]
MTVARFDAPASNTPARRFTRPSHAKCGAIAFRIVRLMWLTARLTRRELVTIEDYCSRFAVSLRSFHRDMGVLREAGLEIEPVTTRTYRMVSFAFDSDCA